jgi:hypothetical protein
VGNKVAHLDGELEGEWYICRPFFKGGMHGQFLKTAVYFKRVEQGGIIVKTTFIPVFGGNGLFGTRYYNAAGTNPQDAAFLHKDECTLSCRLASPIHQWAGTPNIKRLER